MEDKRYVCCYPQGKYCGNPNCRLAKYCSVFPKCQVTQEWLFQNKLKNRVRKTYAEEKEHERNYIFYNGLFGDLLEKRRIYAKKYYWENRDQILAAKRKEVTYQLPIVMQCEHECERCPYEDCRLPEYENKKEYYKLYYQKYQEKYREYRKKYYAEHQEACKEYDKKYYAEHQEACREYNKKYYAEHKEERRNKRKIRNYNKRGYQIRQVVLNAMECLEYPEFAGKEGFLTVIKINGNDYLSFITSDYKHSFRQKREKTEMM